MKLLILGAGPAGLGAAHQLQKLDHEKWKLCEQSNHLGGLSASFEDDARFTWDIGGHVLFSHYDYFDKAVAAALGDAYYEHQRESWVRIMQTWVPYPFQNNVRHLPDHALKECVDGLRSLSGTPSRTANFREWMDTVFGSGIVKYFMQPYNDKVWGVPLNTMSKEWIAERVSVVNTARIENNIEEKKDDLSWGPNNTFRFPKHGGTGAIYEGIAKPLKQRIHLNHEMVSIDVEKKKVVFSNGHIERYDILINTTPLDQLVKRCSAVPEPVFKAANTLVHNGGLVVGLGFECQRSDSKCWMYFPENNCPFYRVTNFHNYSPHNVPSGNISRYSSLMCETTYSSYKPVSQTSIVDETIDGLINAGMITADQKKQIISRYLIDIPYSYPVPTLERDKALSVIQSYFESKGIYSRGRFGAWKYEVANMDHSFMQGVEVVDRILKGAEESTVNGKVG